jgi:hypothetical protein
MRLKRLENIDWLHISMDCQGLRPRNDAVFCDCPMMPIASLRGAQATRQSTAPFNIRPWYIAALDCDGLRPRNEVPQGTFFTYQPNLHL